MGLNDYPDRVDLIDVDDTATGNRMGRVESGTVVAANVHCKVNERDPARVEAQGREATRHTHRFHFKEDPGAHVATHLLWRPPGAPPLHLYVNGTRRPRLPRMPWVVYAEALASGPAPGTITEGT